MLGVGMKNNVKENFSLKAAIAWDILKLVFHHICSNQVKVLKDYELHPLPPRYQTFTVSNWDPFLIMNNEWTRFNQLCKDL